MDKTIWDSMNEINNGGFFHEQNENIKVTHTFVHLLARSF